MSCITGTDIVVDGCWFTAAPYLSNERSHHLLTLLQKKNEWQDKKEQMAKWFRHFW